MKPIPRQCSGCAYFVREISRKVNGYCRRHAPRPYVLPGGFSDFDLTLDAHWPLVKDDDWCGEYSEPKKGP